MNQPETERVLVFDFGSQYAQLIARRVREQNVYCEIVRHDISAERIARAGAARHHPLGRPGQRLRDKAPQACDPAIFELGIPVLGICYGMQLALRICSAARSSRRTAREYGRATLPCRSHADRLFAGVPDGDRRLDEPRRPGASTLPQRFHRRSATTDTCPIAAVKHAVAADLRPAVSSRSHPHAARRARSCANFLYEICGCTGTWTLGNLHRANHRRAAPAGRQRPRHLRPVGRRRFVGRRGAAASGPSARSSPASSSTTACCARTKRQSVEPHLPRPFPRPICTSSMPTTIPRRAGRRHRSAGKAHDHRPRVHRRASTTKPPRSTTPNSSPRARSIPT